MTKDQMKQIMDRLDVIENLLETLLKQANANAAQMRKEITTATGDLEAAIVTASDHARSSDQSGE